MVVLDLPAAPRMVTRTARGQALFLLMTVTRASPCSAILPGSTCQMVGLECWCREDYPSDCPCSGGCPSGWDSQYTPSELCGYPDGYAGEYYSAHQAVADAFSLQLSSLDCFASWATDTILYPNRCPSEESYCGDNNTCSLKTVAQQWNENKRCTVQLCCTSITRCTNMEADSPSPSPQPTAPVQCPCVEWHGLNGYMEEDPATGLEYLAVRP